MSCPGALSADVLIKRQVTADRFAPPSRCPSFLHALREEIGDKAFFAAFKNVLDDHRFKYVTTLAVIDAVNRASGKDYTEWFYRYVAGTEWPEQRKKTK